MNLIWFLLIGLIAGWLAGKLTKGSGYGIVGDVVIGVIGAYIGGFVFGKLGIFAAGTIGTILVATTGAVLLVFVVRALRRA
jgi:uncharacterized membrane protein YeaQ/YmgE (transglycosylase-associated protein family)